MTTTTNGAGPTDRLDIHTRHRRSNDFVIARSALMDAMGTFNTSRKPTCSHCGFDAAENIADVRQHSEVEAMVRKLDRWLGQLHVRTATQEFDADEDGT